MSEESIAVVRQIYRAFEDHRFPVECLAEDFVWETSPELPDAGTYKGRDAVRAYWSDWVGGWYEVESRMEELIDHGDRVVALIHARYRLSERSEPFEARYAHIWTVRNGRAVRARATSGRTPEELGLRIENPPSTGP